MKKQIYILGNRSSQSLSPLIFNHWFKKYKINAIYKNIEVNKKQFNKTAIKLLNDKNVIGLNITIPFKINIIEMLGALNAHAKSINAVNCVVKKNQTLGINTDWIGYKKSLEGLKINKKTEIIILGYGGAAQAIYYSFAQSGYNKIVVFDRSKKQIKNSKNKSYTKSYNNIFKYLPKAGLLVNTTPTNPLSKKQRSLVRKETIISDIVYKPKETKFLRSFKENKKIYGISMLLGQAKPCFKAWFGFEPKSDKALINKIERKIK